MARSAKWKLRERDNRANAHRRDADVMAARTATPAGEQAVGSRLTGPHGVGAPSVTGEDVPASGTAVENADRPASAGRGRQRSRPERAVAEPKELDNAE